MTRNVLAGSKTYAGTASRAIEAGQGLLLLKLGTFSRFCGIVFEGETCTEWDVRVMSTFSHVSELPQCLRACCYRLQADACSEITKAAVGTISSNADHDLAEMLI